MTTTSDLITDLFCQVDDRMRGIPKHPEARLWPSEVVTLGLLHALKGGGNRAFYRWLTRDYRPLFPRLPERTRLFRLLTTHQDWTRAFLAAPTVLEGLTPMALSASTPCAKATAHTRSAVKACRTIAGLLGANSVCSSISGGRSWGGHVPPPMSRITRFSGWSASVKTR